MKVKGLLILTLLLAACDSKVAPVSGGTEKPAEAPAPPAAAQAETAQQFWTRFRAAALAGDATALQSMARFPFVTRGTTDDDPKISHDSAAFPGLLEKILAQDTGLSKDGETVRQYLEQHAELPPIATGGGQSAAIEPAATQFSAGPLDFEKAGDRWLWVSAYLEE